MYLINLNCHAYFGNEMATQYFYCIPLNPSPFFKQNVATCTAMYITALYSYFHTKDNSIYTVPLSKTTTNADFFTPNIILIYAPI